MKEQTKHFESYIQLLKNKVPLYSDMMNEAVMRYYYAISECESSEDVLMEVLISNHIEQSKISFRRKDSQCKFDLYYKSKKEDVAIEFKYHRNAKNSRSCTATKMGAVFSDLNRLSLLKCKKKFFIYIFDEYMKKYYKNNPKEEASIFLIDESINKTFSSSAFSMAGKEFHRVAFSGFEESIDFKRLNYSIKKLVAEGLDDKLYLVILEVSNL